MKGGGQWVVRKRKKKEKGPRRKKNGKKGGSAGGGNEVAESGGAGAGMACVLSQKRERDWKNLRGCEGKVLVSRSGRNGLGIWVVQGGKKVCEGHGREKVEDVHLEGEKTIY